MGHINVLLITADDLNYNTTGCFGCPVDDITPNIDRLASEGMRFENAHVTISVCQPSRQCLLTGLYPHNNGAPGFTPIRDGVETLTGILKNQGYVTGIIGKVEHCQPPRAFRWHFSRDMLNSENCYGRSPYLYHEKTKEFLQDRNLIGKAFFLMVNSHDPHRPFAGSRDELEKFWGYHTYADRIYTGDEVKVPGSLPELDDVKKEVAEYCTSVHRLDETVGEVLRALDESGHADDTIVIFLSDNGMAFPFAKANCYLNSTKTPFVVRWPGKIKPGSVNSDSLIGGVDFMPTILDLIGVDTDLEFDGKSYKNLLFGKKEGGWENVLTEFNETAINNRAKYPMRCVQDRRYGYIVNLWSDGKREFINEAMSGLTFRAMCDAAPNDKYVAKRVHDFTIRQLEEFYDFSKDPDALVNLIDEPEYQEIIETYRKRLYGYMVRSKDPMLEEYAGRVKVKP